MKLLKILSLFMVFGLVLSCNDEDPLPEEPEGPPSIVQLASDTPDLSLLVQAVTRAGLVESLSGAGPFTVLAPTNQAFQALLDSEPSWNSIADIDVAVLEAVLLYHVFSGATASNSLTANQQLTSMNGEAVTVTQVGSTVTFNGVANVAAADIEASNGIVHVIDAVILPPSLIEAITKTLRMVDSAEYGMVFTDGNGMTLYYFARDVKGNNNCTGGCANNWPKFHATSINITGNGFDPELVGEIDVNGEMQSTYNGWPLYTFVNDETAGDFNGEGAGGGNWYVAKPDYDVMLANDQLVGNNGESYVVNAEGVISVGTGNTMYFTDFNGRTLYRFVNDVANQSNFGGNPANWPLFTNEVTVVPSLLDAADFGVMGTGQVTYRANPLYYFGQDAARGETRGVSVPSPGIWPIVNRNTPALVASGD
ncbi:fasciclin domain protein [Lunatimonas lonarensis]|uniref:Fasciclin domain protein n=1 Tax=Lunatimonas lonarensis TaxID=1232681 RepID=R7ZVG8_9BACT|nr:fasciclin domain-containing protein [Lunatimonas lonarensis]EON78115.1 fasciclin domain protein [Lunatimonas lonarensis]